MKNYILISLFLIPFYLCAQAEDNKVKTISYNDNIPAIEKWYNSKNKLDSLKTYYKTGELDEVFYYKNSRYNGLSFKFNKKGEKLTTWEFKNNKLIKRTDHKVEFNKKTEEKIKKYHLDLKELNKQLKNDPNSLKLNYKRARIRSHLNNNVLAKNGFKKIEKQTLIIQKTKPVPEKLLGDIYDHLSNIYEKYEMENYTIHYKLKAINASPKESRLFNNLGSYLVRIKSYRLGIAFLDKAIAMVPNHSFANWALAVAYSDLEDYKKAMTCVNIAFKNEKNLYKLGSGTSERDLRTIRGFLYHKLGESDKGIADLEEALNINSNNSFAYRNLGVIYYELSNYNKACELLKKAKNLGYEKIHDRYDLKKILESSCKNTLMTSRKEAIKTTEIFNELNAPYVFPNPAENIISVKNIDFDNYSIFNFESKLVKEGVSNNNQLDFSRLEPGLYILKIFKKEKVYTIKVVKK
ncbi:MAG: T9SS type A sorting domain-containing protein [Algibacter sp.]